jgi:predicted phosphoadenosine phosphosulfate sulfurtransferase
VGIEKGTHRHQMMTCWRLATSPLDAKQWRQHKHLLQKSAPGTLKDHEQRKLEQLRFWADRHVMRKSFALTLLR